MAERSEIKTPERKSPKQQLAAWDSSDGGKRLDQWRKMVAKIPRGNEVDWIVTHNRPHPDEIVMLWLAGTFPSDDYFRGVQDFLDMRKIDTINLADTPLHIRSKTGLFENRDWLANWERGIRLLGTGGGVLDEHVVAGQERVQGESGATLMARLLGVNKDPALRSLFNYIFLNDTAATRQGNFDLAGFVQRGYRKHGGDILPGSPEDKANQLIVIKRTLIELNEYYENELLRSRAASEFKEHGHLRAIGDGRDIVSIAVITSNNPYMAAHTRKNLHTALTIQKNSKGNIIIMSDQSQIPPDVMKELAATIREEEAQRGNRPLPHDENDLYAEGAIACAPEWYFIYGNILNGTESAPGVEPTGLSLKRFEQLAAEVINAKHGRIVKFREDQKKLRDQRIAK